MKERVLRYAGGYLKVRMTGLTSVTVFKSLYGKRNYAVGAEPFR